MPEPPRPDGSADPAAEPRDGGPAAAREPVAEPAPELRAALEAILAVAAEPVAPAQLADALGADAGEVAAALAHLGADYDGQLAGPRRGFELREGPGGFRLYSRAAHHEAVREFLTAGQTARLSQAALETLAVIAYRQPVTRARIAAIRGVNVDGVVRTLLMRGLIVEAGEDGASGAQQFVTTDEFLAAAGLDALDQLPDIAPFLPEGDDVPTAD